MANPSTAATLDAGKTPAQLSAERSQRFADAYELKQPDRVPIMVPFGNLVADLAGITRQEMYNQPDKGIEALVEAALRFQPDAAFGGLYSPGPSRVLGDVMTKWPGRDLGENSSFQYNEGEYMKAEDYDAFLADPTDWAIRTYLPRVFKELKGLSSLPHLGMASFGYYAVSGYISDLALPELVHAFQAILEAAQEQVKWTELMMKSAARMAEAGMGGMPMGNTVQTAAPFDFMSDTLRGMRGIFLDMRRCPEKLLAAEEKVLRFQVENAIERSKTRGVTTVSIPLHRGSDGFISVAAFEKFYWPQFKKMIFDLTDAGLRPVIFWEGCWNQRLRHLTELPKGKTVGWFQSSDIFKVKEVLGDTMCIMGGMPVGLLAGGTPEEIRERTGKVCQVVGKGGGFIMTSEIAELEGCDPDLIQVWIDATKEYGQY
jgi:hypothetical protein